MDFVGKHKNIFNILDYGAIGDGLHKDTVAIQEAINACNKRGGGVIYFPPGIYEAGTIFLKSNIRFFLETGAVLRQSKDMKDYAIPEEYCLVHNTGSRFVFLHGMEVNNVIIEGFGTIDGNDAFDFEGGSSGRGPLTILIENSENICIKDITVTDSPGWSITFYGCCHVDVLRVKNFNSNADGINPVCCQDVYYDGVLIDGVGDDGICIKNESAGYLYKSRPKRGYLSSDIVVANTTIRNSRRGHPPIKIGTGSAGIFRNILFNNCTFENTGALFTIQLMRPTFTEEAERVIENIVLSNIAARNVKCLVDITTMEVERPVISNISLNNILLDGASAPSVIQGLEDAPVRDMVLNNIKVIYKKKSEADSYWMKLYNADGITIKSSQIGAKDSVESFLYFEAGSNLELDNVQMNGFGGTKPMVLLNQVKGAYIHDCRLRSQEVFLQAIGENTGDIAFYGNLTGDVPILFSGSGEIADKAVYPYTNDITYENIEVTQSINPNEYFKVDVSLRNNEAEGAAKIIIYIDGSEAGACWVWLREKEIKKVTLHTHKYYIPGSYNLKIGSYETKVTVREAPANIQVMDNIRIWYPEANTEKVKVTIPYINLGGNEASQKSCIFDGNSIINCSVIILQPGEIKEAEFEYLSDCKSMPNLRIEGANLRPWSYFTFANTRANFFQKTGSIVIEAGGQQDRFDEKHTETLNEYGAVYTRVEGDFIATVRIASQTVTGMYAAAGLIVSNDITTPNAPGNVLLNRTPKYGGFGMWRADCDGNGIMEKRRYINGSCPIWYRIQKRGQCFRGYFSLNGEDWTECEEYVVPSAAPVQYAGIYAYAFNRKGRLTQAEFQSFDVKCL